MAKHSVGATSFSLSESEFLDFLSLYGFGHFVQAMKLQGVSDLQSLMCQKDNDVFMNAVGCFLGSLAFRLLLTFYFKFKIQQRLV
jgi:hypothetical protein